MKCPSAAAMELMATVQKVIYPNVARRTKTTRQEVVGGKCAPMTEAESSSEACRRRGPVAQQLYNPAAMANATTSAPIPSAVPLATRSMTTSQATAKTGAVQREVLMAFGGFVTARITQKQAAIVDTMTEDTRGMKL